MYLEAGDRRQSNDALAVCLRWRLCVLRQGCHAQTFISVTKHTSREASKSRGLCCGDVQLDIYMVINVRCQQSSLVDCRKVEWLSTRSLVKYTTISFASSRLALFKIVRALDQRLPRFRRRVPSWRVSRLPWACCQSCLAGRFTCR